MPREQQCAAVCDTYIHVPNTDNGIPTEETIVLRLFVTIFDDQPPKEMSLDIWPEKRGSEWLSSRQGNLHPAVTENRHQPENIILWQKWCWNWKPTNSMTRANGAAVRQPRVRKAELRAWAEVEFTSAENNFENLLTSAISAMYVISLHICHLLQPGASSASISCSILLQDITIQVSPSHLLFSSHGFWWKT